MKSTQILLMGVVLLLFSCSELPEIENNETHVSLDLALAELESKYHNNEHIAVSIGDYESPTLVFDFYEVPIRCFYADWPSMSDESMKEMATTTLSFLDGVSGIDQFDYFTFRVMLKHKNEVLNSGTIPIMSN